MRNFRSVEIPCSGVQEPVAEFLKSQRTPLDFELGCGAGVFSIRYASENPKRSLIAVEKTAQKFQRFESRLKNHAVLPNLLALHANAVSVLAHDVPSESLDRVFLWYPNPFPVKARFVRTPFFGQIVECLKKGGELYVASNVEAHAQDYRELCVSQWGLQLTSERTIDNKSDPQFKPRTLFEKKYFQRGERLFDYSFLKM